MSHESNDTIAIQLREFPVEIADAFEAKAKRMSPATTRNALMLHALREFIAEDLETREEEKAA